MTEEAGPATKLIIIVCLTFFACVLSIMISEALNLGIPNKALVLGVIIFCFGMNNLDISQEGD